MDSIGTIIGWTIGIFMTVGAVIGLPLTLMTLYEDFKEEVKKEILSDAPIQNSKTL